LSTRAQERSFSLVRLIFVDTSVGSCLTRLTEPNGSPRPVVNSKGRRRKAGTKSIAQVLKCNDEEFIDFISKCLVWDPERRLKPQSALRHPFITAGRRARPTPPPSAASTVRSALSSSTMGIGRRKDVPETPKKSQISGPAPLSARTTRTSTTNVAASTPSTSQTATVPSSSRSFRVSQPQSSYHSSRTLNGLSVSVPSLLLLWMDN
jgi:dual specificity tyrosine-phosphorylation-regulated kinase 2/3/4